MMESRDVKKSNNKDAWWQPAVIMFARLSAWIAAPVLIAVFLGQWLDSKYDSDPWFFLFLVGAAFVISMIVLAREVTREYKKIEEKNNKKNSDG